MVAVAWDVFAVSETQRHWLMRSLRLVWCYLWWLVSSLGHWHGFLSRRGIIANFMMKHTRQDGSRALRAVGFY